MCFVCLIWFAINLANIDDGDSYKEVFEPLWFAEASLGVMGLAILIGISLFKFDLEQFYMHSKPFADTHFHEGYRIMSVYLLLGAIWVVCLSVSSVRLPHKLDDDNSFTWNEIFTPVRKIDLCRFMARVGLWHV